jgi:tetraacyldisaccharide 4'-kinase
MNEQQRAAMVAEIDPAPHQKVYFSTNEYGTPYHLVNSGQLLPLHQGLDVLLVTSIAQTDVLMQDLALQVGHVRNLAFKDHHIFEPRDFETIRRDFAYLNSPNKIILCTEKDAVKLLPFAQQFQQAGIAVYVLPMQIAFLGKDEAAFQTELQSWLLGFKV